MGYQRRHDPEHCGGGTGKEHERFSRQQMEQVRLDGVECCLSSLQTTISIHSEDKRKYRGERYRLTGTQRQRGKGRTYDCLLVSHMSQDQPQLTSQLLHFIKDTLNDALHLIFCCWC